MYMFLINFDDMIFAHLLVLLVGLASYFLCFALDITSRPNAPEGGAVSEEHGQGGGQRPQAPQRQVVVRRFEFSFQVDLLLLLKLVAVILVFNQDGSRQRLVLLLFLAALVYLYQTGVLTPLIRRIAHAMHLVPAPPQPRQAIRAEIGACLLGLHEISRVMESLDLSGFDTICCCRCITRSIGCTPRFKTTGPSCSLPACLS